MANTVAVNDRVIPRTILGIPPAIDGAGLLAQPPTVGIVMAISAGAATVLWDNTNQATALPVDGTSPPLVAVLRVAAVGTPANLTTFSGQAVRYLGAVAAIPPNVASSQFEGDVLMVCGLAADPGNPATLTDVVFVKSRGPNPFYWIAQCSAVQVVD